MSSVASLELCKELYELIGWGGNDRWYMTDPEGKVIGTATPRIFKSDRDYGNGYRTDTPAYDLGYLLRKLPAWIEPTVKEPHLLTIQPNPIGAGWNALYRLAVKTPTMDYKHAIEIQEADTPEDAACLLAIKLFKQGILIKEGK